MSLDRSAVLERLNWALVLQDCEVFPGDSAARPDLLFVHPERGLVALDVVEKQADARVALNRKVAGLRADFPVLDAVPLSRVVVALDLAEPADGCLDALTATEKPWWDELPAKQPPAEVVRELASQLAPTIAFHSPRRGVLDDQGQEVRARQRVVLDLQQAATAQRQVEDVLVIEGPPGSGKSLVLAARARWLAREHPSWRIQIVCFNRLLVPYLAELVRGSGVHVGLVSEYLQLLRFTMSFDADVARRQLSGELKKARPVVDALLVDEWQDMHAPFIQLFLATVKPGKGGAVFAGDRLQAIYGDVDESQALAGHDVERATLRVPYRSTRQIMEVASALDPTLAIEARDCGLEGEPVDLVYADTKPQQAAAIARDIRLVLRDGRRAPENVAVLVMRKWDFGIVARALEAEGIPFEIAKKRDHYAFDLSAPCVKVMTAHSAKGYEFDLVFLLGLEQLPPIYAEDGVPQGRSALVAITRAKDQVAITYSKDNMYLERLRALPGELIRPWVWPDDYPEVS